MNNEQSPGGPRAEGLYALSYIGAQLGFVPLLVLLLPRRVVTIAPEHTLATLSVLLLLGAVVASLSHIAAGMAGDIWIARHGSRRALIVLGLAGLVSSYALLAQAMTVKTLAIGIVCFQGTLNLMLAPLGALMADYVPNARKGRVAGWLNAGLPLSTLLVTALARYAPKDGASGFYAVAALVAALVLPLVLSWPFGAVAPMSPEWIAARHSHALKLHHGDLPRAWGARLLMQLGASLLINYLYLYMLSLYRFWHVAGIADAAAAVGRLSLVASAAAIIGAVMVGHGADAKSFRRFPMMAAAIVAAAALVAIAEPVSWSALLGAYGVFQAALIAYLAVDSALVAQLLGGHPRRGAYLGVMNLTNTLPGMVSCLLVLASPSQAPDQAVLSHLVLVCALASLAAATLVSRMRSLR